MSPIALREIGQAVYDELQPSLQPDDIDRGETLRAFAAATTDVQDDVWAVATTYAPLEDLLDPVSCPAWGLAYCAGVHGVVLPDRSQFVNDDAWETAARILIIERPARERGTRRAVISAVRAVMEPGALVDLVRRTDPALPGEDAPYDAVIVTRGALAQPGPDLATTVLAAAEPHRVRGHVFHHEVTTGTTWRDLELAGTTWQDLENEGVTWDDLQTGAFTP